MMMEESEINLEEPSGQSSENEEEKARKCHQEIDDVKVDQQVKQEIEERIEEKIEEKIEEEKLNLTEIEIMVDQELNENNDLINDLKKSENANKGQPEIKIVTTSSSSSSSGHHLDSNDGAKFESQVEEKSVEKLESTILGLEKDRGILTAEVLEKDLELSKMAKEIATLKATMDLRNEDYESLKTDSATKYARLKEDSAAKIAEFEKKFNQANRDKESMVMKFATGEREVLLERKGKEEAEKKIKVLMKEKEDLNGKLKYVSGERNRLQQLSDSRWQDIVVAKRELERWKEEVKCMEAKVSSNSSRLKAEVDAHRETREKSELTMKHLAETRAEIETTRNECKEFMQRIRDEEKAKETSAKEQSVKLMIDEAAANELETLREKYKNVIDENNDLSVKVQKMETDRLDIESNMSRLKETVESQKRDIVDLLAQVAENEGLKISLQREEEKNESKTVEIERLRNESIQVQSDMDRCRSKEAELLDFTQKLTDKNVTLQSELTCYEAKCSALEAEHGKLVNKMSSLETELSKTSIDLKNESKNRSDDNQVLARKLAEKTKLAESLNERVIDAENDVLVLKRKNAAALKELTRELQMAKKKLDNANPSSPGLPLTGGHGNGAQLSSRTSSSSSINRASDTDDIKGNTMNGYLTVPNYYENGTQSRKCSTSSQLSDNNGSVSHKKLPYDQIPDSEILVDKIIKLQQNIARKQDKNEFLEEHILTLQNEVKKKNKVIQNYVLKQETGALSSEQMDDNKKRMSEHGGVMSSLYSSRQTDSTMTLELSLEINKKLQAVLEDTLLKNITLKENINTLGNEIANVKSNPKRN